MWQHLFGGLPGEQRAVWCGSRSEVPRTHEGNSAAPALAMTSVKQPVSWSPVAETTRSRSILLSYPSLSSWTWTHVVKEDNVGDTVVLSHWVAKDNRSHPSLWEDDKYCFWKTTRGDKRWSRNSNAVCLIQWQKGSASLFLIQTLQRSWRMCWMSFMVKEFFPNTILSRYVHTFYTISCSFLLCSVICSILTGKLQHMEVAWFDIVFYTVCHKVSITGTSVLIWASVTTLKDQLSE